jgi:hypothetical protein
MQPVIPPCGRQARRAAGACKRRDLPTAAGACNWMHSAGGPLTRRRNGPGYGSGCSAGGVYWRLTGLTITPVRIALAETSTRNTLPFTTARTF